ncbi:hypothetical protein BH10CHL1_BH10CHL1_14590 [soil metagenome]
METPTSFGLWLQARRKTLGLTQQDLAERIACSRSLIRKIEADERRPSRQIAELLTDSLQISAEERPLFLRVARQEMRIDRLAGVTALPPQPLSILAELLDPTPPVAPPSPVGEQQALPKNPPSSNLPKPLMPLIGRAAELAAIQNLLHDPRCRLITLIGLGGIGKTRLAIEAAGTALFPDGVYFIALAPLLDQQLIVPTIAAALGISLQGAEEPQKQLSDYLQARHLLLVLDNAEHLLNGVVLAAALLQEAQNLKLLVTSRERLNLQNEWVFEVQGLPIPLLLAAFDAQAEYGTQVSQYTAIQLFVDRAQRAHTRFDPAEHWQAILRICQLVEGLPLGIELAAVWVNVLSCQEIAQEIERNIDFLSTNLRDLPPRHRSLRAAIGHSWVLLTTEEQQALQRLAIFRGTFTRAAAERVAAANLPLLAALMSKSLVQREPQGRYALHELVRQYAAEQLHKQGLIDPVYRQYVLFYLALAEEAAPHLVGAGIDIRVWLGRLDQEINHWRATLEWSLSEQGDMALALRLTAALGRFWYLQGYWREGQRYLTTVLSRDSAGQDPRVRGQVLLALGSIQVSLADFAQAQALFTTGLAIFRPLQDQWWMAWSLFNLALVAMFQGDTAQCVNLAAECLVLFRVLADRWGIALGLAMVGVARIGLQSYEVAKTELQESTELFRALGDLGAVAGNLNQLGSIAVLQQDLALAEQYFRQSLTIAQEIASKEHLAWVHQKFGELALLQMDPATATTHFQNSFLLRHELGDQAGMLVDLNGLAAAAALQAQTGHAVELWGAATALAETLSSNRLPQDQLAIDDLQAKVRVMLSEEAWRAAWGAGRMLSLAQLAQSMRKK